MQVNSSEYWDHRFKTDWAECGGPHQTRFFAELLVSLLPEWLKTDIRRRGIDILDYGCAEGDAVPILADAFPGSDVQGADVAVAAITIAHERHPDFRFTVLDEAGAGALPKAGLIVCSNVLEHFAEWGAMLEAVGKIAREHVVVLVPFREAAPLADEHMVAFDCDLLPPRLEAGHLLTYVAVIETTFLPASRWVGHQLLAVWSHSPPTPDSEAVLDPERLDLRGLNESEIRACLRLAKQGLSTLSQERGTNLQLRTQLRQQSDEANTRITELNNQLIQTTTDLKNELLRKTTDLNNELFRTTTELNNEIWRMKVDAEGAAGRLQNIRDVVSAHNARLAAKSAELQAQMNVLVDQHNRLMSKRVVRWGVRLVEVGARLSGRRITLPGPLGKVSVAIESCDLGD